MDITNAQSASIDTFGNRKSAFGNGPACPVCGRPFENDPEVGPVPTCRCSERGKVEWEACPLFPSDNERMMNAKWSGPDHARP